MAITSPSSWPFAGNAGIVQFSSELTSAHCLFTGVNEPLLYRSLQKSRGETDWFIWSWEIRRLLANLCLLMGLNSKTNLEVASKNCFIVIKSWKASSTYNRELYNFSNFSNVVFPGRKVSMVSATAGLSLPLYMLRSSAIDIFAVILQVTSWW